MKDFLLSTLFAIAILNCVLGYSGSVLSYEAHRVVSRLGADISNGTLLAFAVQPLFYFLAIISLGVTFLGLANKLTERFAVYLVVLFMTLDIILLLISTWGFGLINFIFGADV